MADRGPPDAPGFAPLLRELRHRAGLTQEELAAAAGLSPRALGNLERGRSTPHRGTASRLAQALHLSDQDAEELLRAARLRTASAYAPAEPPVPADAAAHLDDASTLVLAVIGSHPSRLVSVEALGMSAVVSAGELRGALERLSAAGLLSRHEDGEIETRPEAYALARERTQALFSPAEQAKLRDRLVQWYLATADAADRVIAPLRFRSGAAQADAGQVRRVFSDRTEAVAWCERHQEALAALAQLAYRSADPSPSWQIPWALGGYLDLRRPPALYLRMHEIGLASAREHGDLRGQAAMLIGLGLAHYYPRRFDDAADCFREARELWRTLGEPAGEAGAVNCLANVHLETRRLDLATAYYRESLTLYRAASDRRGEAVVLTNLAETYCEATDYPHAAEYAREAVLASREAAYPRIEAMAACQLARALGGTGRPDEASILFHQALLMSRGAGDQHALAWTLTFLGHHQRVHGQAAVAASTWREAIDIFDELADPHADRLRAELITLI